MALLWKVAGVAVVAVLLTVGAYAAGRIIGPVPSGVSPAAPPAPSARTQGPALAARHGHRPTSPPATSTVVLAANDEPRPARHPHGGHDRAAAPARTSPVLAPAPASPTATDTATPAAPTPSATTRPTPSPAPSPTSSPTPSPTDSPTPTSSPSPTG